MFFHIIIEVTFVPGSPGPNPSKEIITTTIPPPPNFENCPKGRDRQQLSLDGGEAFATISAKKLNLTAFSGTENLTEKIKVFKGTEKKFQIGKRHLVDFFVKDDFNQSARCTFPIDVIDTEKPRILFCPDDITVHTYRRDNKAYVKWPEPEWKDNIAVTNITSTEKPGFFAIGLHKVIYTASDSSKNKESCSFNIFIKQDRPRCGIPSKPKNSELTCRTDQELKVQLCVINCLPGFQSALKWPKITCNISSIVEYPEWRPKLDDKICQKPSIARAKKTVQLIYDSPCSADPDFYQSSIALLSLQITKLSHCGLTPSTARIGFCSSPEKYMKIECLNSKKINLNVTTELNDTKNLKDTEVVKTFVEMAVREVRKVSLNGNFTMKGTDDKKYAARPEKPEKLGKEGDAGMLSILCDSGHKIVEDGCLKCPKGTFLKNNQCELCAIGFYQEVPGSDRSGCRMRSFHFIKHKIIFSDVIVKPEIIFRK